ncbi:hypothetical protein CHS0354_032010 [Potamilus streckersoni]|uniref:Uncharacterized protein n=1 Tax=Potamilus streckersoni TaxID=2493646 RepID=A0AAE0TL45_9BIVA|nr:hypothetical protein CHS0354_032010 [Potamilus streckersoni]
MRFSSGQEVDRSEFLNALSNERDDKGGIWSGSPVSGKTEEFQGREVDMPECINATLCWLEDKDRLWSGSPFSRKAEKYKVKYPPYQEEETFILFSAAQCFWKWKRERSRGIRVSECGFKRAR